MTIITPTDNTCDRCYYFLGAAAKNHLDNGTPAECPRCGADFAVGDDWLVGNGYNTAAELDRRRRAAPPRSGTGTYARWIANPYRSSALCAAARRPDPAGRNRPCGRPYAPAAQPSRKATR